MSLSMHRIIDCKTFAISLKDECDYLSRLFPVRLAADTAVTVRVSFYLTDINVNGIKYSAQNPAKRKKKAAE